MQMFCVFTVFTHASKNIYCKFVPKKNCLGVFLKISKCGHLITCSIGIPVTGCYNIYVGSIVLNTNVNSLIS